MIPAIRTTLVYGLISAFTVMPITMLLATPLGFPTAFKLTLWADLFFYAMLLARWNSKGLFAIAFPLALLLGAAFWPGIYAGFFFLGLGALGWIRSGICFSGMPIRAIFAEMIALSCGAGVIALLDPGSTVAWALCIWLFFLIQCLYFFIVPETSPPDAVHSVEDPFERARRGIQRVLREC